MKKLEDVSLKRMIVHIVAVNEKKGKEKDELEEVGSKKNNDEEKQEVSQEEQTKIRTVYSDYSIDLEANTMIKKHFQERIKEISKDRASCNAIIDQKLEKEVVPHYKDIISYYNSNLNKFILTSKLLGKRLRDIMQDRRIDPGVLAVCVFETSEYKDDALLAILKLDITHAYVVKSEGEEEDNSRVEIKGFDKALPTSGERLQKGAIIKRNGESGWDMIVLDRQVGKRVDKQAAEFFRRFLGAKWEFDKETLAKIVYSKTKEIGTTLSKSKDEDKRKAGEAILQDIDIEFKKRTVDVDAFLGNKIPDMVLKEKVKERYDRAELPSEIEIEPETAEKLTSGNVKYSGDDELILIAPKNTYERLVKEKKIGKGKGTMMEITITTSKWEKIK